MNKEQPPFAYIKQTYGVKADMYRQVIVGGKKGVITKDMGNYIGVNFYDENTHYPSPCHPTSEVEYLDTFDYDPPMLKISASKKRYMAFLEADSGLTFSEYLGIKRKQTTAK